jgi:hypothetical protein
MKRLLVAASAALLLACAHALQPADPAQVEPGRPETASGEAAGVRVAARASGWRAWPDDLQDRLTPIELSVWNEGSAPVRIRADLYELVAPGGKRRAALSPGALSKVMRQKARPGDAMFGANDGTVAWPGARSIPYPYAWSGLRGPGPLDRGSRALGPDPRPAPDGVVQTGGHATVMLFFDVPADDLSEFTFEAKLEDAGGSDLGTVRLPFRR